MPVVITISDTLADALIEARGSERIFRELAAAVDSGFHIAGDETLPRTHVAVLPGINVPADDIPATAVCRDCHATYYVDNLHLCGDI